jgi:hypothetical protein
LSLATEVRTPQPHHSHIPNVIIVAHIYHHTPTSYEAVPLSHCRRTSPLRQRAFLFASRRRRCQRVHLTVAFVVGHKKSFSSSFDSAHASSFVSPHHTQSPGTVGITYSDYSFVSYI